MAFKVPIPTGGATDPPRCFIPVSDDWRTVFATLLAYGLKDHYFDGTDEQIEAANAEVYKWFAALQEYQQLPEVAIYGHTEQLGTHGGGLTGSAWNTIPMNTVYQQQSWCSVQNNVFTLDSGHYHVRMTHVIWAVDSFAPRFFCTGSDPIIEGMNGRAYRDPSWSDAANMQLFGHMTINSQKAYKFEVYCGNARTNWGLGVALNYQNLLETYGYCWIEKWS
jgi:hypothetical protein